MRQQAREEAGAASHLAEAEHERNAARARLRDHRKGREGIEGDECRPQPVQDRSTDRAGELVPFAFAPVPPAIGFEERVRGGDGEMRQIERLEQLMAGPFDREWRAHGRVDLTNGERNGGESADMPQPDMIGWLKEDGPRQREDASTESWRSARPSLTAETRRRGVSR